MLKRPPIIDGKTQYVQQGTRSLLCVFLIDINFLIMQHPTNSGYVVAVWTVGDYCVLLLHDEAEERQRNGCAQVETAYHFDVELELRHIIS